MYKSSAMMYSNIAEKYLNFDSGHCSVCCNKPIQQPMRGTQNTATPDPTIWKIARILSRRATQPHCPPKQRQEMFQDLLHVQRHNTRVGVARVVIKTSYRAYSVARPSAYTNKKTKHAPNKNNTDCVTCADYCSTVGLCSQFTAGRLSSVTQRRGSCLPVLYPKTCAGPLP